MARKKKDFKRAEGNSNKDAIKRSCKERLHAISFNLLPTPSASFSCLLSSRRLPLQWDLESFLDPRL